LVIRLYSISGEYGLAIYFSIQKLKTGSQKSFFVTSVGVPVRAII
jgi:hypothetical protein